MTDDRTREQLERENAELRDLLAEVRPPWPAHLRERVDQALRRRGDPPTREDRARLALARAGWTPDEDGFAVWLRAVERYEVGPVQGMTPGERFFRCLAECGATEAESEWPTSPRRRAPYEDAARELKPETT
jgi:hypothetical protein